MHNQNKFKVLIHNEYMFMEEQRRMHRLYRIETNERNFKILMLCEILFGSISL